MGALQACAPLKRLSNQKIHHARRMEVYAGMVDAMDMHIGRLMDHLREIGEFENTLFIFTSDNGAEGSNLIGVDGQSTLGNWFDRVGYNADLETLGEPGSFNAIGPNNATIAASPLAYYKFYASEGGLRVPLVMSGPGIGKKNEMSDEFVFVTDLTPTILSIAGVEKPAGNWKGSSIEEIVGTDFSQFLTGNATEIHSEDQAIGYELGGNRALFKGDYKIVFNRSARADQAWHLFNIKTDPGESRDLALEEPGRFASMRADYEAYESNNNVLPMPEGYIQRRTIFGGVLN